MMNTTYLNISDIQHFSVGDGPGIRTTVFLKGCNLHCPWCHNPETISPNAVSLFFEQTGKTLTYGRKMSLDDVLENVMEDAVFYRESGGGVTFSGGEPMLQWKSLLPLCRALHELGVHTLVDTAGCVPWEGFEALAPYVDCFFFDVKSPDVGVYKDVIGGSFDMAMKNLERLTGTGKDAHARLPLIPKINDSLETAKKMRELLRSLGVEKVDLIPFHRLGSGKYTAMGLKYDFADTEPQSKEHIMQIADVYREHFTVTVEK